jgi:hypothetical protein
MATETRDFPLRVVLTVTTGRLLTEPKGPRDNNGIGDLYSLLDWMTDDSNFTHQIPRVGKECSPWLLKWFPELARADERELDGMIATLGAAEGIELWLESLSGLGMHATYAVPRLPKGEHEAREPLVDLLGMMDAASARKD